MLCPESVSGRGKRKTDFMHRKQCYYLYLHNEVKKENIYALPRKRKRQGQAENRLHAQKAVLLSLLA